MKVFRFLFLSIISIPLCSGILFGHYVIESRWDSDRIFYDDTNTPSIIHVFRGTTLRAETEIVKKVPTVSMEEGMTIVSDKMTQTALFSSPTPTITPIVSNTPDWYTCYCQSDELNCSDAEAKSCFDYCNLKGFGDVHNLDSDGDNLACEGN